MPNSENSDLSSVPKNHTDNTLSSFYCGPRSDIRQPKDPIGFEIKINSFAVVNRFLENDYC